MNEVRSGKKRVLLMLSGGRDSFLSVCRLIAEGYHVTMITYDNGRMSSTDNVLKLVKRIEKRFGEDTVSFAGIHTIAQNINPLLGKVLYSESNEIADAYPHLVLNQLNCLACHTVMYLHSIAYCKAHGIDTLAEGARKQQKFFVELPEMRKQYKKLCRNHGIELCLPVYDLDSDIIRKEEIAEWGFLPKSYEPQCWTGCPLLRELDEPQRQDLERYYETEILPVADEMIEKLFVKKKIQSTNIMKSYV